MQERRSLAMNLLGYLEYKSDPRIQNLAKDLRDYDRRLRELGVKDHEIENIATIDNLRMFGKFLMRSIRLCIIAPLALPGGILIAPIAIIAKVVSIRKAKEALAESSVKLRGYDVIGTWKILIAAVLVPTFFFVYSSVVFYLLHFSSKFSPIPSIYRLSTPASLFAALLCFSVFLPFVSYATIRAAEVAIDVARSLWPLTVATFVPRQELENIRKHREELKERLAVIVREFGPVIVGNNAMKNFGLTESDPRWIPENVTPKISRRLTRSTVVLTVGDESDESDIEDQKKPFDNLDNDALYHSDEEYDAEDRLRTVTRWVNATISSRNSTYGSDTSSPRNASSLPIGVNPNVSQSNQFARDGDSNSHNEEVLAEFERLKARMSSKPNLLKTKLAYAAATKQKFNWRNSLGGSSTVSELFSRSPGSDLNSQTETRSEDGQFTGKLNGTITSLKFPDTRSDDGYLAEKRKGKVSSLKVPERKYSLPVTRK
ncbi:hypothetical protein HK096_008709 [Nowakowskiella sp. JEL0078]|nr:hypothetical protein HK096_008709 [Nowakowskiella sp. JEL0078]